MPSCPNCGKEVSEGMTFCPTCGQRLTETQGEQTAASALYEEVIGGELGKRMNWFERHLNWTMFLVWVGIFPIAFLVVILAVLADPTLSEGTAAAIGSAIGLLVPIPAACWVLGKKKRSMWWLLLSWSVFFLLLDNKSPSRDRD